MTRNRISSVGSTNASYDNNGNVASLVATGQQTFNRSYSYDSLNRLAAMTDTASAQACKGLSWTYDAWGSMYQQTTTSGTCAQYQASAPPNPQNRLVGAGSVTYLYDAAGNMTYDGTNTYYYDAENRLVQVNGTLGTCSTATACYLYDGEGRRIQKTVGSTTTAYIADIVTGKVIEQTNGSNTMQVGYAYMGGVPLAEYFNGTTYFFHTDHLGSTRLMTGVAQTVGQNLDYYPFGQLNPTDSGITNIEFTGDLMDPETGLDHTDFRQYAPLMGGWLTPGPAGLAAVDPTNPQSWNRYAYVLNNPLKYIDPTGLECVWDDGSYDSIDDLMSGNPASCAELGGTWIDHSFFTDFGLPDWSGAPVGDLATIASALQNGLSLVQTGQGINGWMLQQNSGNGGNWFWTFAPPIIAANNTTPAQAGTNYCQQHGQLSFNIPFTHIPVTISLSATAFFNFSTTNDVSATFPPSAGLSLDITAGAPSGFNVPVQVGVGKNASVGTFLTPNGPSRFSLSIPLSPVAGSPITVSPNVGNVCGMVNSGG